MKTNSNPFEICAIWNAAFGRIGEGDCFTFKGKTYRVWKCVNGETSKFMTTCGKLIPATLENCKEIRKAENVNVEFIETLECILHLNMFFIGEFKQQERRSQLSKCMRVWSPKRPFSYLKLQRLVDTKNQNN